MDIFYSKIYSIAKIFNKEVPQNVFMPISRRAKPNGFIEEELEKLIYLDEKGEIATRNKEFIILDSLLFDLKILEIKNQHAYSKYKKMIKDCSYDQYFGFRLESHIAALLTDHKESFTISESPDFIIETNPKGYIECTSRHLNSKKTADNILKSIRNSLIEKSKKKYCTQDTALFVDITNLLSQEWTILKKDNTESLDIINSYLKETSFGNLTLFSWLLHYNTTPLDVLHPVKYECLYWRFDNDLISPELSGFLNRRWPKGTGSNIKTFHYPRIG